MSAGIARNLSEIVGVVVAARLFLTEPTTLRQSLGLAVGIGGGMLIGWALERHFDKRS